MQPLRLVDDETSPTVLADAEACSQDRPIWLFALCK
jgi:hypothetical protein